MRTHCLGLALVLATGLAAQPPHVVFNVIDE
jgi:hypothetical protein